MKLKNLELVSGNLPLEGKVLFFVVKMLAEVGDRSLAKIRVHTAKKADFL